MSLLYECINGIIQGGILGSGEDDAGREEIASLCVNKLRSMIMVDGDPNRECAGSCTYPEPLAR
jgi:AP-3 complex subunit delta-1